jgi:hypothetical protein
MVSPGQVLSRCVEFRGEVVEVVLSERAETKALAV